MHRRYVALALVVGCGFPLTVALGASSEMPAVVGTARDGIGNVLSGVEVLIVSTTSPVRSIASTTTDVQGHFRVAGIQPGLYRIAAVKHGYGSFVGEINTRLDSWVQLILHPRAVGESGEVPPLPEDSTWALRLPRRSVLHEVEAQPAATAPADVTTRGLLEETLHLQVDQLFAVAADFDGRSQDDPVLRGTETHLKLSALLTERASLRMLGHHESLDATIEDGRLTPASTASRDQAALQVAFSYDTHADGQLSVSTFYSEQKLRWFDSEGLTPGLHGHEQRAWGSALGWSKQLGGESRVAVSLGFQHNSVGLPEPVAGGPVYGTAGRALSNRTMGASGTYDTVKAETHQVRVQFQAHVLRTPAPGLRVSAGDLAPSFVGPAGLSVGLQARDTWHVGGPFSLVYGFGYKHAVRPQDGSLIVPQIGGRFAFDSIVCRFLASYHAISDWGDSSTGPTAFRLDDRIGYEAEIEVQVTRGFRLLGATSFSPIQLDILGYDGRDLSTTVAPIYLTDGNAAVRQNRVTLVQERAGMQTYAEVTRGRAEGTVAAVLTYDLPYHDLSLRSLRYTNGRVGLRFVPVGTNVELEYRQIDESRAAEGMLERGAEQRSVELRLIQDLMRLRTIGHWRLLMGVRVASVEASEDDGWLAASTEPILDSMRGRVSAGLSLEF